MFDNTTYTAQEVADTIGVHVQTVRSWANGEHVSGVSLPSIVLGSSASKHKRRLFHGPSVADWLLQVSTNDDKHNAIVKKRKQNRKPRKRNKFLAFRKAGA